MSDKEVVSPTIKNGIGYQPKAKIITAILLGGFLLAGCTQTTTAYTDYLKPVFERAKSVLENVDIQPTPEQAPEDDIG